MGDKLEMLLKNIGFMVVGFVLKLFVYGDWNMGLDVYGFVVCVGEIGSGEWVFLGRWYGIRFVVLMICGVFWFVVCCVWRVDNFLFRRVSLLLMIGKD